MLARCHSTWQQVKVDSISATKADLKLGVSQVFFIVNHESLKAE